MATRDETAFERDLLDRGYSRRQLAKATALLGAGAAAIRATGALAQQAAKPVAGAVRIGANECWTGPFPIAAEAGFKLVTEGNRYEPDNEHQKLFDAVSAVEGIPVDRIVAWPGSSDPLSRVAVAFASPTRGIVTANPTYEAIWRTGDWLGAKVTKVPLTEDYAHDVKAMLAADPNAGLYYICSPNNPTGTVTPVADIQWLADNKPKDAILVVDEAYIHWTETGTAAKMAATRDDVIVLRTFSKLFGMAGMRLGLTFAAPALMEKMMRYDGGQVTAMLPMTAVACGTVSVAQADLIKARRAEMIANREKAIAFLTKKKIKVIPGSHANMFMIDWGKPAKPMADALLAENVQIGRSWPIWPNVSRVSVGSAADMDAFCAAVDKVWKA
ncbi:MULTISPECIES: pyridoxal phosphate-dependent aminotransferase [unclassified Sphingobium]|uniref:pyridoxal phosphate-dependent aminotransferase n=1 Tax=unclassified Sphingobium TaxID=2611147 RepID=UPI000D170AAA|nr:MULTISPECIES: pyridoxal phosphate-dependent aminotransferase [unclassified Sphingobium]MBG6119321.1 histidinol-phosphate aminotransferase [Sphingobium sp. JAI105]PSO10892.1 aminotransferase [Sphingobium sp. AEW4]TWD04849.1 histidinol-phosphate aminotransferase [Sphingobium sp. AEW010]TWD22257.1 histidinol-phosphate aminotransferase [Sphingobium sp. AEW013]TWD24746.1 histidinol-phosphate aminotransferase [Sphingobium sp. AEW001]